MRPGSLLQRWSLAPRSTPRFRAELRFDLWKSSRDRAGCQVGGGFERQGRVLLHPVAPGKSAPALALGHHFQLRDFEPSSGSTCGSPHVDRARLGREAPGLVAPSLNSSRAAGDFSRGVHRKVVSFSKIVQGFLTSRRSAHMKYSYRSCISG